MPPDPCGTSSTTLTAGIPTAGSTGQLVMGMFQRLVRTDQPESTKRALALMAGGTLCFCLVVLTLAVWYQAVLIGKVDTGLNVALGIISGSVAALAGVAYRKQDEAHPTGVQP